MDVPATCFVLVGVMDKEDAVKLMDKEELITRELLTVTSLSTVNLVKIEISDPFVLVLLG